MKKLRTLTLLAFVLAVGLCSCSSDDEQKKEEPLDTQILGTWSAPVTGDDLVDRFYLTFKKDTCFFGSICNKEVISEDTLSYKIKEKTVTLVPDSVDNNILLLNVSSINATTMIAKFTNTDGYPVVPGLSPDADCIFTKVSK